LYFCFFQSAFVHAGKMVDLSSKESIEKATVQELKQELKNAGLTQGGVKAELVERLWTWAQTQQKPAESAPAPAAQPTSDQPSQPEQKQQQQQQQPAAAAPPAQQEPAPASSINPENGQTTSQQQSKHAKIVFDEQEAKRAEAKKLEVIKPAKPEATAPRASPPPTALSEEERAKLRAEKFKDPEVERKKNRAERFNIASPELESERARKRAERFGVHHPDIEAEKSRKRKERFGAEDPAAKLQSRAERFKPLETPKPTPSFGTVLSREEIKARKERQARFQTTS